MACTIPGCGSSGHNRRTHDKHVPPGEPLDPTRFLVGERGPSSVVGDEEAHPGAGLYDQIAASLPHGPDAGQEYERFLDRVDRSGGPDACHPWTAGTTGAGYGQYTVGGETVYAHRWILGYLRGSPLGPDEFALHHCDNPPCVNPSHLHIGDQKQNMRECVDRGRADLSGLELGRGPGKTLGQYRVGPELCGSVNGYKRHLRHGEETCEECRAAVVAYNNARKADRTKDRDDTRVPEEQGPQFVPCRTERGPDVPIVISNPGVYELTAEEYHSYAVTGDWFSNSDAKALLASCPAQFDYDRRNAVRKTSDAFDFGHVWHAVILGKGEAYQVFEPKKLDGRTGPGKEQKAAVDAARAAGITPIYGDQFKLIEAMAEAVKDDPVPHALMTAPGRQEVCLFWYQDIKVSDPHNALYGQTVQVQRRAMIDHLPDMPDDPRETVRLVDGKTADHVKPDDDMRKKIYDYAYHRQAETYAAAVEALFNRDAEVVFIFQSKKAPHLIVPVELDTPAMRVAAAENRQAMEIWAECVATGEWPGYTKGVATSGVPAWIERQYEDELVIG